MGEQNMGADLKSMGYFFKNNLQLMAFINSLEEERGKIEFFRRELPLCMILFNGVINQLKHEVEQDQNMKCVSEEFEEKCEHEEMEWENCVEEMEWENCVEEMDWTSSDQPWSVNYNDQSFNFINNFYEICIKSEFSQINNDNDSSIESESSAEDFLLRNEEKNAQTSGPDLSPAILAATYPAVAIASDNRNRQTKRKARRCWSPELHRHFVATLQELSGRGVETPKQVRKNMMVRELTKNEVKNHLQKYKLHNRRMHMSPRLFHHL